MKKLSILIAVITVSLMSVCEPIAKKSIGEIYVFESDENGFNTKTIFYDDGKEVIAFDAQFTAEYAKQSIEFLKTKTKSLIKYIVVTHPNPDKFNGAIFYQKQGAKLIMSKDSEKNLPKVHAYKKYYFVEMAKIFTNETYPKTPNADITFEDSYELKTANGSIIKLTEYHSSGISTNQTVAYIENKKSLIVGDLIHFKAHAWLEGPIKDGKTNYNTQNWINVLNNLRADYDENAIVYGGRGIETTVKKAVLEEVYYLNKADEIARNYINSLEGKDLASKKETIDYKVLTTIFEKEFPDYSLSYMVKYGAYGLVESIK